MRSLKIKLPFDAHVHLRDEKVLKNTVPYTAKYFKDAIVMPNLNPPITNVKQAKEYKKRVQSGYQTSCNFHMALYLTESTTEKDVIDASKSRSIIGFKLYPANATTNSSDGIGDIKKIYPILEVMQTHDVPLLVHGEVTDEAVDIFRRETKFLPILESIVKDFPRLKVSLEHITTAEAVDFVQAARDGVVATITPQHLLKNRNSIFNVGGKTALNPHSFCLPILKTENARQRLLDAIKNNTGKFFAGTDSAPHLKENKESACGCAGCFTAPYAIQLYATAVEEADALDRLEDFLSVYGRVFYRIPVPRDTITIEPGDIVIPEDIHGITPFMAGETLLWQVK